jgi:hypothetical protein
MIASNNIGYLNTHGAFVFSKPNMAASVRYAPTAMLFRQACMIQLEPTLLSDVLPPHRVLLITRHEHMPCLDAFLLRELVLDLSDAASDDRQGREALA